MSTTIATENVAIYSGGTLEIICDEDGREFEEIVELEKEEFKSCYASIKQIRAESGKLW